MLNFEIQGFNNPGRISWKTSYIRFWYTVGWYQSYRPRNFALCSRSIHQALQVKNKLRFIDGTFLTWSYKEIWQTSRSDATRLFSHEQGTQSPLNFNLVSSTLQRPISVGGVNNLQLSWCCRTYVDWDDVGSSVVVSRVKTFSELITSGRFLACSRMNICLREGACNDPTGYFQNQHPVWRLNVSSIRIMCYDLHVWTS